MGRSDLENYGLSGKSAVEEKSEPAAEITWPSSHLIRTWKRRARAKGSPAHWPLSSPEPQKNQNLTADAERFPPNVDMAPFYFIFSKRKSSRTSVFFLCGFLIYLMVLGFLLNLEAPTLWSFQLLWGKTGQETSRTEITFILKMQIISRFELKGIKRHI